MICFGVNILLTVRSDINVIINSFELKMETSRIEVEVFEQVSVASQGHSVAGDILVSPGTASGPLCVAKSPCSSPFGGEEPGSEFELTQPAVRF